jgi:hypothetical protein
VLCDSCSIGKRTGGDGGAADFIPVAKAAFLGEEVALRARGHR